MTDQLGAHMKGAWAVRAQDNPHGMKAGTSSITLTRPIAWRPIADFDLMAHSAEERLEAAAKAGYAFARDTFHFCLDGIVSNHSRGAFNGGLVVLAPLDQMPSAMGLDRDDTWVCADKEGALRLPSAILLAPSSMELPPELDSIAQRYAAPDAQIDPAGFLAARDEATHRALRSVGREPQMIGTSAIHMGSISERMEDCLNQFQVELNSACRIGPESRAREALADLRSSGWESEPEAWMRLPKGEEAALRACASWRGAIEKSLSRVSELVRAHPDAALSLDARERFFSRVETCLRALDENAPALLSAAAAWGKELSDQSSCRQLPPPLPGMNQGAHMDWAQSQAESESAPGQMSQSFSSLAAEAKAGRLNPNSAILFDSMDGMVRAREARFLLPGAFPAASSESDLLAKLEGRKPSPAKPVVSRGQALE